MALVLGFSGCQKMDSFDDYGMLEAFTGQAKITPGIDDNIMPPITTTYIMTFNSDGETVTIGDSQGEPFSLRDMLLKNASEDIKKEFKEFLPLIDIHPDDQLAFSGFKGSVVEGSNGRLIKINQFAGDTRGLSELNVKVDGYGKIDKKNKMYIETKIDIFINLQDLEEKLPELLEFFTYGENSTPLSQIDDGSTRVNIARIHFNGVSLTGLI